MPLCSCVAARLPFGILHGYARRPRHARRRRRRRRLGAPRAQRPRGRAGARVGGRGRARGGAAARSRRLRCRAPACQLCRAPHPLSAGPCGHPPFVTDARPRRRAAAAAGRPGHAPGNGGGRPAAGRCRALILSSRAPPAAALHFLWGRADADACRRGCSAVVPRRAPSFRRCCRDRRQQRRRRPAYPCRPACRMGGGVLRHLLRRTAGRLL